MEAIGRKVPLVCIDPIAGTWRSAEPGEVGAVEGEIVADTGAGILLARVTHTFKIGDDVCTQTVQVGVAASAFAGPTGAGDAAVVTMEEKGPTDEEEE